MILVDLNQVMVSNMMMQIGNHKNAQVDEGMLRHMVLNSLRKNRVKFHREFGEFIICADDKNYWRKNIFPYYKASRKKDRDASELDWNAIFTALNNIREELKEFFPYKVIQVETAEADDIIGTIVHHEGRPLNNGEPILILSGDKDYKQLHTYANVKQYDPTRKRFLSENDPDGYLFEHIVKGDRSDGIPNAFSSDNCLVINERQKQVTKKRLEALKQDINSFGESVSRGFKRNEALVDLKLVPKNIKVDIMSQYEAENTKNRSQLLNYFIKNKLKYLMESIGEF